jgi:hypothetical protein
MTLKDLKEFVEKNSVPDDAILEYCHPSDEDNWTGYGNVSVKFIDTYTETGQKNHNQTILYFE